MNDIYANYANIEVEYQCPDLNISVLSIANDQNIHSSSSECELCGDHGSIYVYVRCECGESHDVTIDSW